MAVAMNRIDYCGERLVLLVSTGIFVIPAIGGLVTGENVAGIWILYPALIASDWLLENCISENGLNLVNGLVQCNPIQIIRCASE
jgi:hypothetical protein